MLRVPCCFSRPLAVMLTVAVVFSGADVVWARGALDQSLAEDLNGPAYALGNPVGDELGEAQTFTAGLSGLLDTVAMPLWTAHDHGRYFVEIQGVTAAGAPDGVSLARTSVDTCRIRTLSAGPWMEVAFPQPATVAAESRYAIVVERDRVDPLGETNGVWYSSGASYGGGGHLYRVLTPSPQEWTHQPPHLGFRTYVSATGPITAKRDTTTLALTSSHNPVRSEREATYTARVTNDDEPAATPKGTVTFFAFGSAVSAQPLDASGLATYKTSFVGSGDRVVAAAFCPETPSFASSEAAVTQAVVNEFATTTTLTVEPDPTIAGQEAKFTATVSPVPLSASELPTGGVDFKESDGTPIAQAVPLIDGKATIFASIGAGRYTVRAEYPGDSTYSASAGTVAQTVNRAATATTISSATNPVTVGGEFELDVGVRTLAPGFVRPEGPIVLTVNGQIASSGIPLFEAGETASEVVVVVKAPDTPQTGMIGARYLGDPDTEPSSSAPVQETVVASSSSVVTTTPAQTSPVSSQAIGTPTRAGLLQHMTASLAGALKRHGFSALTGTTQILNATEPGTLTQRVYAPKAPASALTTKQAPKLLASGSRIFTAPGTGKMRLRLTSAGRKTLRRAKALRLAIVTRFAPATRVPVVVVKRLTVKRRGVGKLAHRAAATTRGWRVISVVSRERR